VSTAVDYMRFCQVLPERRHNSTACACSLPDRRLGCAATYTAADAVRPGPVSDWTRGLHRCGSRRAGYYGKGTLWWGGDRSTCLDRSTDDLIVVGMIQQMAGTGAAPQRVPSARTVARLVYQAIVTRSLRSTVCRSELTTVKVSGHHDTGFPIWSARLSAGTSLAHLQLHPAAAAKLPRRD